MVQVLDILLDYCICNIFLGCVTCVTCPCMYLEIPGCQKRLFLFPALKRLVVYHKVCHISCLLSALMHIDTCLLYTSPSPRDQRGSRMPSSA